jgi:CMP-N-acetylneuraminate monooxygenase
MPYAGFFHETAPRDHVIARYNVKNGPNAIVDKVAAKFTDVTTIDPLQNDLVTWKNGAITVGHVDRPPLFTYDTATVTRYMEAQRALLKHFDIAKVADYFCQSEFKDDLIVYLVLTDDDYAPEGNGVRIDFSAQPITYRVVESRALQTEFEDLVELNGYHHLLIKARTDSLWQIVYFGRPLEELTLGFQCRIDRKPDQYNAAFWKHYTTYGAPMLRRGEDYLLYKLLEGAAG